MKKMYLLMLCLLLSAGIAKSQTSQPIKSDLKWQLIKEESGVKIYFTRDLTCLNPNAMALKIENSASQEAKVDWVLPESLKQIPMNQSNSGTINVKPGETASAGCNTTAPMQLTLIVADTQWVPGSQIFTIKLIPEQK